MFCPKCGQNLKDGSLFCAYCGTSIKSVSPQPATASVPQTVPQPAPEKKSGKKGGLIAAIVAVVVLCFASVVLILFGLSKSNTGKGNEGQLSYYKDFDEDDVVFPEDGEAYVDGQLLITVNDDANEKKAAKLFDSYDGEIVGYNYATNTYQVEFDAYDVYSHCIAIAVAKVRKKWAASKKAAQITTQIRRNARNNLIINRL